MIKIEQEAQAFEETRVRLAEEFAEKDDEGKAVRTVNDDGREAYVISDMPALNEAIAKIAEEQIELPYRKIRISLDDLEGKELSPMDFGFLEQIMDIDAEEEEPKETNILQLEHES